ncbi:hypothetical protein ACFPM0_06165 [Pseudonocardia sulfidoxydans]|uniref:hypothetical protein n=1 Tax=Pseudonocardia sulfidoxydans TaxID=54011 RepID=UPI003608D2ED
MGSFARRAAGGAGGERAERSPSERSLCAVDPLRHPPGSGAGVEAEAGVVAESADGDDRAGPPDRVPTPPGAAEAQGTSRASVGCDRRSTAESGRGGARAW